MLLKVKFQKNMNKTTFVLLLAFVAGITVKSLGQTVPVDADTKLITYKEIVQVTGSKTDLYNRALEWINTEYKNPLDVTRVKNVANGVIELVHRIEIYKTDKDVKRSAGTVDYTLKLEIKDGRYRYNFNNFLLHDVSKMPIEKWLDKTDKKYDPVFEQYLQQVDARVKEIITSLKSGMLPPQEPKKDEW